MKQFAKIALGALMLTGAATAIATAPAQAQVGFSYGYYGGGYGGGVCDPRSRWYNPYRCDDSGYYGDGYYGYGGYGCGCPVTVTETVTTTTPVVEQRTYTTYETYWVKAKPRKVYRRQSKPPPGERG